MQEDAVEVQRERDPAEEVADLVEQGAHAEAVEYARDLHPAELGGVLSVSDDEVRELLLDGLEAGAVGAALAYMEPHYRDDLLTDLPAPTIAAVLRTVPDDVATDVVQELPPDTRMQVLGVMPARVRQAIRNLLAHDTQTAGGRMTGQRIAVPPQRTVREVIRFLRDLHPDTEQPFYVYVTNEDNVLVGLVSTRALLTSPPDTRVGDVAQFEIVTVTADTDQEETARLLKRYNLLALPVVDEQGHLLGTVTADDLLDVLEDEATEDMFRMVGVDADEDLRGVASSVRHRLPWLTVNLFTALLAASVVGLFQDTIERVAILAAFMPVIAGQGGNAGIQTVTVVVRSLALGRISPRDANEILAHEFTVGVIIGSAIAVPLGVVGWMTGGAPALGVIVAVAILANIVNGMVMGVLVPLILHHAGQDPAVSAGIWLTAFTDVIGLLVLLGLGTLFVGALT